MTDAPKPLKRRRRKLIVAFVVLVSLVLAWWYWPRGDARFVGKWRISIMQAGKETQLDEVIRYARHGRAYQRFGEKRLSTAMAWSVEGNELVLVTGWPTFEIGFANWLGVIWRRVSRQSTWKPLHFEILEVAADEIHIRYVDAKPEDGFTIMRRIPE